MKPLDPRLLRYARAARGVLLVGAGLGLLRTAAILAWCWCIAQALAALVLPVLGGLGGAAGRVSEGAAAQDQLPMLLAGAVAAIVVRSLSSWGMDVVAARGAIRAKAQLRAQALDRVDGRSPEWAATRSDAESAVALGRGLDALDGYFSGYLPQLILTAFSTPVLILILLLADPMSGLTVVIVFPVIPIFMILIGLATQAVQDRQWEQLQRLSASFLDVVTGLATLKIFRREQRQVARIAKEAEEYRTRTMRVLRVTFLSGFVLDLAGTFSIALVAVTVGTRLVAGEFPLALGLFVLLLLPEVFVPIRQVGAAFHASTEGLAAAQRVFALIEDESWRLSESSPADSASTSTVSTSTVSTSTVSTSAASTSAASVSFESVVLQRDGRAVIGPVSFEVAPGEVVGLAGPSGAGKSTLVSSVLGFLSPISGIVERPEEVSWSGQRPGLLQGTVGENVALGDAEPNRELIRRALHAVGLQGLAIDHALGVSGSGLSGGQAQRVAIARCLYRAWDRNAGALVLDEPTSALDRESEALVCAALRSEAANGRAVLVVSHREAVLDAADRVITVEAAA
ncbi:thiol reductant ABC exporter subunit CydD [Leucobacter sp. GX24907]